MKDESKLTIDEAVARRGSFVKSPEKFIEEVKKKQDELFKDLRCLVFSWVPQEDGSKKLMGRLPNGKVVFVDRREQFEVKPGRSYICLVYEREREAFARIICEEDVPVIWVLPSKLVTMRYKDESGKFNVVMPHANSYKERILLALDRLEKLGVPEVKIVFRENEMRLKHGE